MSERPQPRPGATTCGASSRTGPDQHVLGDSVGIGHFREPRLTEHTSSAAIRSGLSSGQYHSSLVNLDQQRHDRPERQHGRQLRTRRTRRLSRSAKLNAMPRMTATGEML